MEGCERGREANERATPTKRESSSRESQSTKHRQNKKIQMRRDEKKSSESAVKGAVSKKGKLRKK
jgi:hypothetical protein